MRVLMITSEWPDEAHPHWASFIVQQVDFLRKAGIEVDVFPFRGAQNPMRYLQAYRELRTYLKQNPPYDVFHAQFGQSALLALPNLKPLVITFHGSDVQGYQNERGEFTWRGKLLRWVSYLMATRADEAIIVSAHLARFLPKKAYHIIPCGLDLERFYPMARDTAREKLGMSLEKKIVFFAAHPERPVKRYALAEAAMEIVRQSIPEAELLPAVNIPFEQMPLYMNAADALLLTSIQEGSPTVIKEALACNLPIVSTDVGDVRARIAGVNGTYIAETSEALATALIQILKGNQRISGQDAAKALDERLLVQKIIQVYQQTI